MKHPYIPNEQYTAAPTSAAPKITDSGAPAKETPFLSILLTAGALVLAWRWRR